MYIALRCTNCGRDHPLRDFRTEDIIKLMLVARLGHMHEFAENRLSSNEWFMILSAEMVLRMRSGRES